MNCPLQIAELELSLIEMSEIIEKYKKKTPRGYDVVYDVDFIDIARDLKDYFIRKLEYNIFKETHG